ncbi:MAG: 50S ribosomal protein L18 [Anaerolineales bacterium]|nr:50S ribosomal protein L18 [Anaerolineales bacterium]NOR82773.1 50S ribosomal protein L18 [Ardenticatenales bacterium]
MNISEKKRLARLRRHRRVRKKISGTADRPRLNVYRSLTHIYGQVVDDTAGHTLASASTVDREVRSAVKGLGKTEQARVVGQVLARRALEKGIKLVIFDRGGWLYHGRIKALAEGARKEGLEF